MANNKQETASASCVIKGVEEMAVNTKAILDSEEKVSLMIPRPVGDKSKGVFLSLNGINYQIAYDVPVEVPRSIAELWYNKVAADNKSKAYVDQLHETLEELGRRSGGGGYR